MSLVLAVATALLFSLGTWLLLQRSLTRTIIGLGLMGHGANLLMLLSGRRRGVAPFVGSMEGHQIADPMPQALALTAIPMIVALRETGGTRLFDKLVADHLRLINEALNPKEYHPHV